MQVIIDRFEGDFAIVELANKEMVNVPIVLFPDAKEGDVVDIIINTNETDKRKKNISELFNRLKNRK